MKSLTEGNRYQLMLATFLFHHSWNRTLDQEVKRRQEETICKLAGQKKLEDENKYPEMLSKVNKVDMVGTV